jgi:hypothetical protein
MQCWPYLGRRFGGAGTNHLGCHQGRSDDRQITIADLTGGAVEDYSDCKASSAGKAGLIFDCEDGRPAGILPA